MNFQINKFKDGQITVSHVQSGNLHLKFRGNSYEDLFTIASIKEAWDAQVPMNKQNSSCLTLYALMGQRSDRRFNPGESFDLKVIASFINSLHFDRVEILHPHSPVTLALIQNAVELDHSGYVQKAYESLNKPVLISPDAGAYKSCHGIAEKLEADLVPANKVRLNGKPVIQIQGTVKDKECLIIDDIADGGRTFMELARELRKQGARSVFLYVTHGQFNFGVTELLEVIDHIFCTNSFKNIQEKQVTQFRVFE